MYEHLKKSVNEFLKNPKHPPSAIHHVPVIDSNLSLSFIWDKTNFNLVSVAGLKKEKKYIYPFMLNIEVKTKSNVDEYVSARECFSSDINDIVDDLDILFGPRNTSYLFSTEKLLPKPQLNNNEKLNCNIKRKSHVLHEKPLWSNISNANGKTVNKKTKSHSKIKKTSSPEESTKSPARKILKKNLRDYSSVSISSKSSSLFNTSSFENQGKPSRQLKKIIKTGSKIVNKRKKCAKM